MPRACTVCTHPERPKIDQALIAGEPFRNIAERTGTSATALTRHKSDHLLANMKSCGLFPQMDPLPGSLHLEWKKCGRPHCRCASGELHGPYWIRRWREGGRQRKQYVPVRDAANMAAAIARWHGLHPPVWKLRQELALLRQLSDEVIDD